MNTGLKFVLAVALGLSSFAVAASDGTKKPSDTQPMEGQQQFETWEREFAKSPDRQIGPERMKKALRALERSAELEYPEGLRDWAMYFTWPDLWPTTQEQYAYKFRLLRRAVELGDVDANVALGIAYNLGQGVAKDPVMYVHHQCVAKRAGNESAAINLQSSAVGNYAEFARVSLRKPVLFHARPDMKAGGITFLRAGQEAWQVARYSDGWTALYVPDGCLVGFVETRDLNKAQGAGGER